MFSLAATPTKRLTSPLSLSLRRYCSKASCHTGIIMRKNTLYNQQRRFYAKETDPAKENTVDDADIEAASQFRAKKQVDPVSRFPTAAVILSGSGFLDGTDVVEAAALSIQLLNYGIRPVFYAPENTEIGLVYNHLHRTQDPLEERWAFKEAARFSKDLTPLSQLNAADHLALLIPSGDGSIMTLTDIFQSHEDLEWGKVNADAENAVKSFHSAKKPIVATGAASVFVAQVLGTQRNGPGVTVVVGDGDQAKWVELCGSKTKNSDEILIDRDNAILSLRGVSDSSNYSVGAVFEECGNIVETLSTEFFTNNTDIQRDRYLQVKGGLPAPEKQAGS